ncbi:hypothetical protein [uncultured Campylobacter sp.]|uniref:hypothetical protein n=1 Tax=uncultured Campylobacter sp. TaxID=218934 RepID=UPI00262B3484|nr:hypothetical protein [uncultured Campylobacter sp.]
MAGKFAFWKFDGINLDFVFGDFNGSALNLCGLNLQIFVPESALDGSAATMQAQI